MEGIEIELQEGQESQRCRASDTANCQNNSPMARNVSIERRERRQPVVRERTDWMGEDEQQRRQKCDGHEQGDHHSHPGD